MKSTLYIKFIVIYIIFGFLSIFSVATLTSGLASAPLIRTTSMRLYREATLVASDYLPGFFSEQFSLNDVRLQLSGIETHLDAAVWFVDREGTVITSAQSEDYYPAPSAIEEFNPAEAGNSRYLTGDYHGYFENEVITVIAPVVQDYLPRGYLLIHKNMTEIDETLAILMRASYITLLVIYALSFVILLAFQFFVYRPLSQITEAAKQYASGNLDYEIPVNTEDEMGYLSASLNYMSSQLKDMEDYQKNSWQMYPTISALLLLPSKVM